MYGSVLLFRCRIVSYTSSRYYKPSTNKLLEFLADMPKANSSRIAEAQRQRQNISKKGEKYGASTVYLQVLGSGSRGSPCTLYMFTDQKRYLFNCGEGTQRMAHEHKVKLSRLGHIFVTSKSWRNIGGLPGLSLTLQDVGVPNITLHGPEGLDEIYNATKRFVIMKDMKVTMASCSEDFQDSVMRVRYVLLTPPIVLNLANPEKRAKKARLSPPPDKFSEFIDDDTDYYGRPTLRKMKDSIKNEKVAVKPETFADKRGAKLMNLVDTTNASVAYICTLHKRLGTLDLEKCVERGVKPGPQLGLLKSGKNVVLADGTLVRSQDVKTPDDPGPVFIVLDVPDISYLHEAEFSAHFNVPANPPENVPALIVHFTPPAVFNDAKYQQFIDKFGPQTTHLLINEQNTCLGSEAVHRTQHKLNLLDTDIFPLLKDSSIPPVWRTEPEPVATDVDPARLKDLDEIKNKVALAQFKTIVQMEGSRDAHDIQDTKENVVSARTLTTFHLRPKKHLDRSMEPKLRIQDYIKEPMEVEGFPESLKELRLRLDSKREGICPQEYPKVVFLGTGSCIPSKTRNTSAFIVHLSEHKSILMDCGEGTFGQMARFYGPRRIDGFLRTLKAIYVSHLHADHHIGLIGVIQARQRALLEDSRPPEPVYLLAPGQIISWLAYYDTRFESLMPHVTLIPNQSLLKNNENRENISAALHSMGLRSVDTCLVAHCPNAFGVSLTTCSPEHKITYSGDTIPCDELVQLGENSTLLIHEATMEDDLETEARIKMHSTTTQAIDIGCAMNAKFTVLTHFSQRYARLPRLDESFNEANNNVGIAFDNMQIRLSDLTLLPHMVRPLRLMFADHCEGMDEKADKREQKRQSRPSFVALFGKPRTSSSSSSHSDYRNVVKKSKVESSAEFKCKESENCMDSEMVENTKVDNDYAEKQSEESLIECEVDGVELKVNDGMK